MNNEDIYVMILCWGTSRTPLKLLVSIVADIWRLAHDFKI
jgi:hypothetical protein